MTNNQLIITTNMFNKIKAIKDVRSQAKVIEKALNDIEVVGESNGVKIVMNGKQEVKSVNIEESSDMRAIAKGVENAINDINKKLQKEIQAAMKEAGGFPDLSALGM